MKVASSTAAHLAAGALVDVDAIDAGTTRTAPDAWARPVARFAVVIVALVDEGTSRAGPLRQTRFPRLVFWNDDVVVLIF